MANNYAVPPHSHSKKGDGGGELSGVAQEDQNIEEFPTAGAQGTVPTAQADGSIAMDPAPSNLPAWEEDGNSPYTETAVSSITYTMAAAYDRVMVTISVTNTSEDISLDLQVNGDIGTNYDYIKIDGTTVSGTDAVRVMNTHSGDASTTFEMAGRWSTFWGVGGGTPRQVLTINVAEGGENQNVTSPLSQFTLSEIHGGTADITIEVYGRDL